MECFVLKFKPSVNAGELLFYHMISSHTLFLGDFLAVKSPIGSNLISVDFIFSGIATSLQLLNSHRHPLYEGSECRFYGMSEIFTEL